MSTYCEVDKVKITVHPLTFRLLFLTRVVKESNERIT